MSMKTIIIRDTAKIHDLQKQPAEVRPLALDFTPVLIDDETIESVEVADSETGIVSPVSVSGQKVLATLGVGTAGEVIPVSVRVSGSMGSVLEADILLSVVDPLADVAPVVLPREDLPRSAVEVVLAAVSGTFEPNVIYGLRWDPEAGRFVIHAVSTVMDAGGEAVGGGTF